MRNVAMNQLFEILKSVTADEFNKVVLGIVALVSLFVSPLIQWYIARRQAADNISAKRQVWIDELRKEAAEFLAIFTHVEKLLRPMMNQSSDDDQLILDEYKEAVKRSTELGIRIKLRLNPKEDEHNEFVRLLSVLSDSHLPHMPNATDAERSDAINKFYVARDNVIGHLQLILKHEWERVKKGEI
jgi:hypothetical protein